MSRAQVIDRMIVASLEKDITRAYDMVLDARAAYDHSPHAGTQLDLDKAIALMDGLLDEKLELRDLHLS